MYAIIEDGSHQYKAVEGEQLTVDFRNVPVGEQIDFDRVLLVRTDDEIKIGQPTLENAKVVAEVCEQVKGDKIYVQKFRRRKKYRRRTGHRQPYTCVAVQKIEIS